MFYTLVKHANLYIPEVAGTRSKILFLLLLYFFICHPSIAQTSSDKEIKSLVVSGIVIDSANQTPLAYVTVVVLERRSQKVVKHTLTSDAGTFEMTGLAFRQYQLVLSYVGYKTKTIVLPSFTTATIKLGKIALSPTATQLEEVQITTQRPLIEQDTDKIAYNVDADPEQDNLTSLEMLRKVPLITIDIDNNLLLSGKNNYQVLINGNKSSLVPGNPADMFQNLPASSIKKIEIITVPSSKYEAEGIGGIINIVTHKKSISGYNGTVNLTGNTPGGYTAGGNISSGTGKIGVSVNYRNGYTASPTSKSNFYRNDLVRHNRLEQITESDNINRLHYLSSEISYQASPQHNITAGYNRNWSNNENNYTQHVAQYSTNGLLSEAYQNLNTGENEADGYDATLSYYYSSKKIDEQQLSITYNQVDNTTNSIASLLLQPILNYKGRESITANFNDKREYTVQADFIQPLGKQTLEIGIKSILEKSSSNYFYKNRDPETNDFIPDQNLSNSFDYRQNIHAAYLSLNLQKKNWGLRSGIRVEETRLNANFSSSGTKARQRYHDLFPTVNLSHMIKTNSTFKLSYSKRIERPGLYYLNPYVDLIDPLNISFGNPDLSPATSHTFQLDFDTFFKSTFFNASITHSFTNNSIQEFITLGTDSVARTTFGNMGSSQSSAITLGGNTTLFKKLTISINSGINYVHYASELEGISQQKAGFMYYLQGNTTYRFSKSWRASGSISYNSPNILLQGKSGGYTWNSLSLNKEFLKNSKASISLLVRSPFQRERRSSSEITNVSFYQFRESYIIMRQVSLSFNYRFGRLR